MRPRNMVPARWDHPEDYDYCQRLKLDGWAWEFLRRNVKYRNEWDRLLREYGPLENKDRVLLLYRYSVGIMDDHMLALAEAGKAFGLHSMVDPNTRATPEMRFPLWRPEILSTGSVTHLNKTHPPDITSEPLWMEYFGIDTRYSTEPQLREIKRTIKRVRSPGVVRIHAAKPRSNRWPLYLRTLDGIYQTTVPASEVAAALIAQMPKKQTRDNDLVGSALAQAANYRRILAGDPNETPRLGRRKSEK